MFISCLKCAHIIVFALFTCSTQINFTVAIDFTASNGELTSLKHCSSKEKASFTCYYNGLFYVFV